MPVKDHVLERQAKRLLKLPFAPTDPKLAAEMVEEFTRVLRPRVITDKHCALVIDHLIDHAGRCPPPSEVIEATEQVEAPDEAKAPFGCEKCQGSGYVSFTKRVEIGGLDPYDADFAKECDCALGEFKRAAWARMKEGKK